MKSHKENAYIRSLSEEDRLLAAHILDMTEACDNTGSVRFSFFLDERQGKVAQEVLQSVRISGYTFSGGFENAKRRVLAVFLEDKKPEPEDFPISPLEFIYRKSEALTHRDFLGAILAQRIKREALGDILVNDGNTIVFVYNSVSDMLLREITKIGSAGVKLQLAQRRDFIVQENFQEISGTVASMRTDCLMSLVTKLSREKSAAFIKSTGVDINYEKCFSASTLIEQGDIFSLRGYGKYVVADIGGLSKKGKTFVRIHKYI